MGRDDSKTNGGGKLKGVQQYFYFADPHIEFDAARGEAGKVRGMDLARLGRAGLLEAARGAMVELALSRQSREVTADDISLWLIRCGRNPSDLGPATPSVFRSGDWEWTGRWQKSERVSNHRSDLRVWRLRYGT